MGEADHIAITTASRLTFESDELRVLREMVTLGLMKEGRTLNEGRDQYFIVTEQGIAESNRRVEPLPKLTRSQRNYRAYLKSECNESFIEFLRNPYWADFRRRTA